MLGFTHPGPVLFKGQPMSSTDTFQSAPPLATGSTGSQPESITELLSGIAIPSLPAVSGGMTQPTGVSGYSEWDGGGSGVSAPQGTSAAPAGPPTSSIGSRGPAMDAITNVVDAIDLIGQNSPVGRAVAAAGVPQGLQGAARNATSMLFSTLGPVGALANGANFAMGAFGPQQNIDTPAGRQSLDATVKGLETAMNAPPVQQQAPLQTAVAAPGTTYSAGPQGGYITMAPNQHSLNFAMGTDSTTAAPTTNFAMGVSGLSDTTGAAVTGPTGPAPNVNDVTESGPGANAPSAPPGIPDGIGLAGPDSGTGDGGASGDSVICTLLHERGLATRSELRAANQFRRRMGPEFYAGYLLWAAPLVRLARRSPLTCRILYASLSRVAFAYMREIEHPGSSRLGHVTLAIAVPICRLLGRLTRQERAQTT